jgi:uncharacterized protein (TIGR00255 family)
MMMSMTGFASRTCMLESTTTTITLRLSLKTVNSRYFEANCRIPNALADIEPACLRLFKQQLIRGTIQFNMSMATLADKTDTRILINAPAVRGYTQALQEIARQLDRPYTPEVKDLLIFPDILQTSQEPIASELIQKIMAEIAILIKEVAAQRAQEGKVLLQDLQDRMIRIRQLWTSLQPYIEQIEQEERAKFQELAQTLPMSETANIQQKLLETLSSHLDRLNVHEEFVRFISHVDHLQTVLTGPELEKGKRIDFITQEMLREANTLNAKSHHAQIGQIIVNIKVELEKMREQAQNIV